MTLNSLDAKNLIIENVLDLRVYFWTSARNAKTVEGQSGAAPVMRYCGDVHFPFGVHSLPLGTHQSSGRSQHVAGCFVEGSASNRVRIRPTLRLADPIAFFTA